MEFVRWTEIEAFYNIRKATAAYPEVLGTNNTVTYRSKVKLHGSNAAIQIGKDGSISTQSRTSILTPTSDNAGFAKRVDSNKNLWEECKSFLKDDEDSMIFFGEWCGSGIQSGVAISQIPNKIFAIFAIQILPGNKLIVEPSEIVANLPPIADVFVLPWYGPEVKIPWLESSENLQPIVDSINTTVFQVEKCDPWVFDIFDIEGAGEGLVFYPVSHPGRKSFGDFVFKAKGDKHKVVKIKAPVQVDPEKVSNAEDFAALVLTNARLEQGAMAVMDSQEAVAMIDFNVKNVGKFIGWISKDVEKETKAELEASGLDWKFVSKTLSNKARVWYLNNCKQSK